MILELYTSGSVAYVRGPDVDMHLVSGVMNISITPAPGVWCEGKYVYKNGQHLWWLNPTHFVGLVDGMRVWMEIAA